MRTGVCVYISYIYIHICLHIYIHTYLRTYVRTCIHAHTHTYATYLYVRVHTSIHTYVNTYTYIRIHLHMYFHEFACVDVYTCTQEFRRMRVHSDRFLDRGMIQGTKDTSHCRAWHKPTNLLYSQMGTTPGNVSGMNRATCGICMWQQFWNHDFRGTTARFSTPRLLSTISFSMGQS